MTFKKLIGQIHLWLGLASGLVVFIISVTGCLYAFIDEIKPVVYKDRLFIEAPSNAQYLPVSTLIDSAQKALGKDFTIQSSEIPADKNGTVIFRSRKFNEHAFLYSDYMEYFYRVYVNPYTGQVVKVEDTKWEFFNLVVNAHINLLLGYDIGGQIVGWSVGIFVITLITGLVLWWPKNKKAAKSRVKFQWKETTKWKRKNYDLHNILGFYTLIIALVIALTGLVWAYKWFDESVQWVANGGKTIEKPKPVFSDTTSIGSTFTIDEIVTTTRHKFPEASLFVGFPKNAKATVSIFVNYDNIANDQSFKYDQYTGKLLETSTYESKNNGAKLRALNYDIHTGSVLDLPGKILAFIASLISASLPITGFIIWYARGRKSERKKSKGTAIKKNAYAIVH